MTALDTAGPVWDELVAAAVLGTERRPFGGMRLDGPVAAVADRAARTAGLAGAAAAVWAYRQAGRIPAPAAEPAGSGRPEPAPPDGRPLLGPGPVRTLRAILDGPALRPVLPEWLGLAAGSGRRLPEEWLPDLLDACRPPERAALEQLTGPRGRWLAALNPDWSATIGTHPGGAGGRLARAVLAGGEDAWAADEEVPDGERILAFAAVRSADAERGRRLAESIWAGEPGATRAAIVAAMADGLSMADEPFLEARLDDRRRGVRTEAAALLRRLPDSRLAARMAARTLPLVRLAGGRSGALEVDRPASPAPDALRDGAADLTQMVGATPLAAWEAGLGRPPAELVAWAARSGGAGAPLIDGWAAAAAATSDPVWARALLEGGARPTASLLRLVPAELADRAAAGWIRRTSLGEALPVLSALPVPWSPPVSGAVLDRLGELIRTGPTAGAGPVRDGLRTVATALHPGQAPATAALAAAAERLPSGARGAARVFWARSLASMAATVHFRQAMYQEFR